MRAIDVQILFPWFEPTEANSPEIKGRRKTAVCQRKIVSIVKYKFDRENAVSNRFIISNKFAAYLGQALK